MLLQHEAADARSAENVKTSGNLCKCFEFLSLAFACVLLKLIRLQISLHQEVIASLRVIEDQFAELAVNCSIKLFHFETIDFSPFTEEVLIADATEVNRLNLIRQIRWLRIARNLFVCLLVLLSEKIEAKVLFVAALLI